MSDIKTKFINDPEQITPELLEGYVLAYPDQVKLGGENIVVRANPKSEDKVAIVTLGGSGHEPALSGFVGEGMLDCSVVGDIFAAPGAQRLFQALQLMKREAGILLVVLNHSGDVMSANMACQLAERVGIKVKQVLTHDDISAGIGADINDRFALEIDKLQDCRAVEQVELRDGVRLCDGREVHHLIFFQQQGGETLKRFRAAYIQPQLGKALQEKLVHLLCSFKRSRISASSSSSFVGSGSFSGSGSALLESFSCILFTALTMQNTAKAMMIKSRMTAMRLP